MSVKKHWVPPMIAAPKYTLEMLTCNCAITPRDTLSVTALVTGDGTSLLCIDVTTAFDDPPGIGITLDDAEELGHALIAFAAQQRERK